MLIVRQNWRRIVTALLVVVMITSALFLSKYYSDEKHYPETIAILNQKRGQIEVLSASAIAASVGLALVPDDSTTPVADQLADLSSYLMVIDGVILFEEFVLTLIGKYTFLLIVPFACLMMIFGIWMSDIFAAFGLKLYIFSLLIMLLIPVSADLMTQVDKVINFDRLMVEADESEEENDTEGFFSTLSASVDKLTSWAQEKINGIRSAMTSMIVSTCLIPLATLWCFSWLMRIFWGLPIWDTVMGVRKSVAGGIRSMPGKLLK